MRRWIAIAFACAAVVAFVVLIELSGPSEAEMSEIAQTWFAAIQERDLERLATVDGAAPVDRDGPEYDAWQAQVAQAIARYELGRDRGRFEPDERGYAIARATMVGEGTYWEPVASQGGFSEATLTVRLNFGYGEIPYGGLPRGTTAYLLGYPLGTVHAIVLGRGEKVEIDVLQHLDLRIQFHRVPIHAHGDARYKIERVEWIPDSAVHEIVHWYF